MMARGGPVAMTDIISELRIPKSTAYELVNTLISTGYLEPAGRNGSFYLGRKLYELGMAYRNQVDLLKDGAKIVEELRDATGETVQLSVLEDGMMLVLLKQEGNKHLRIISQVGSRVPVNWAASGRLLVSDMEEGELRRFLSETVKESPTGRAKTDVDLLVSEIREFRAQGYGTEVNEANEHAGCVAAPVLDSSGHCIASISVVAPAPRITSDTREQLIAAVTEAADKLTKRLSL
jgi:DNA-binding IclR family transcriptional regulator